MSDIKFGTDGWRAIIADDYTVKNVIRVAEAAAIFMEERAMQKVVIGYDCRFGGKMFAETAAQTAKAVKEGRSLLGKLRRFIPVWRPQHA